MKRPSFVWLVPLGAAAVCTVLGIVALAGRGPSVTVSFATAEGIEPGKTKIRYKDVDIGTVDAVRLAPGRARVLVDIDFARSARDFAVDGSRFWVVRPRVGASGITGLDTVLSGAYIGVDRGRSTERRTSFTGLETPPAVMNDENGRRFELYGESLGSVAIGSPIYYRRAAVGRVVGYRLAKNGAGVAIDVFVEAPYDGYVRAGTRWWHASGIGVRLDSSGMTLDTQSVAAVLTGGLAFGSPAGQAATGPVENGARFPLAEDVAAAMRAPDGPEASVVMRFDQSVRGLQVGAAVDFRGVELGHVTAIGIEYDPRRGQFTMPVTMALFPDRLGARYRQAIPRGDTAAGKALLRRLVARGLRGQLRTGNVLTNQRYIALDVFPDAPRAEVDMRRTPLELPTVPNTLEELQMQLASIARKLDRVPFDEIGSRLSETLSTANHLFAQLDTELAPQARDTLAAAREAFGSAQATLQQDSPLQSDMHRALVQLTRTLQTLDELADYLQRHPEALVRGKAED
ncbi:MlaD family protein [Trinickia caryophylli]|uniref:Paraquat-inducible protein B n=1 Tax=Trinickia caryophylli TaxID=28094 RepID=A0A1X7FNR6_TRICW|nr:MlaD family protein [Trinickia caryophylli]WQE14160.1 MlaD family protein [Trinickia caryophylli]GLU33341.1 paraquat-inducible protein [Trinickia caryophylli]SMF54980.1 paraquat-inducible protein B [Trinickia caryophylli]